MGFGVPLAIGLPGPRGGGLPPAPGTAHRGALRQLLPSAGRLRLPPGGALRHRRHLQIRGLPAPGGVELDSACTGCNKKTNQMTGGSEA